MKRIKAWHRKISYSLAAFVLIPALVLPQSVSASSYRSPDAAAEILGTRGDAYRLASNWDTEYAEATSGVTITVRYITDTLSDQSEYRAYYQDAAEAAAGERDSITLTGTMPQQTKAVGTVTSSDPAVVEVDAEDVSQTIYAHDSTNGRNYYWYVGYRTKGYGKADLTFTLGNATHIVHIYVLPWTVEGLTVTKAGFQSVRLRWKAAAGADGYQVYRNDSDATDEQKTLMVTVDAATTTVELEADWNTQYDYLVAPYVIAADGSQINGTYPASASYTLLPDTLEIKNIVNGTAAATGSIQTVSWNAVEGAEYYSLLRAEEENGTYQQVAVTEDGKATGISYGGEAGHTYYYKVRAYFPGGKALISDSFSAYLAPKKTIRKSAVKTKTKQSEKVGQYSAWGNWAAPDQTYYYTRKDTLHLVTVSGKKLYDYTLADNGGVRKTKTVNLGKFDHFGGFYKGEDDCFYVAVGYNNLKESKTKTAIKVTKYSAAWKKGKTCKIKGGVKNAFPGIYQPFDAGNCRMAMQGSNLILFTSRTMFQTEDGLHHQSNIGFCIHTKKMTAKEANLTYCSHSFNQFVRFSNGDVYQLDHGDAYPRALEVTVTTDFGTPDEKTFSNSVLAIVGATGDNFTGVNAGGMEVGKEHLLIAGLSTPQKNKVAGVTGNDSAYKRNAFLITTTKTGAKAKLKWLTKYHPKKSKTTVGECRLIKLSDTRFAVMYDTYASGNDIGTLHYVLVDDSGRILLKKNYKNTAFTGGTQPILWHGSLFWSETVTKVVKKKDRYGWDYNDYVTQNYHYRIPVRMK